MKLKNNSKGPNCTTNRNTKLLMVSSNTSDFTVCHTSYKQKDLKEKMYFKTTQASLILHLKWFSSWICFPRKKKLDKSYPQKQLKTNFETLLRTYFCIYKATLQVHPPKLVSVHTYLYAPTHFRFKKK